MGSGFFRWCRVGAALVLASAVLVMAEPAMAITGPKTLADRRPVQTGPVEPGFPIDYVGVVWDMPDGSHAAGGSAAVRFKTDGRWGPWTALVDDGAEAEGQWASGLVPGGDADAYQVRGVPALARSPRATAINTTDGPEVTIGEMPARAAGALASSRCRSRADWGADENLRFGATSGGGSVESWPAQFHPVQTLTVHHTAGANDDNDPAATVRAIYRYHAVDRGWGDVGYQYLVDESGVIYEGRWSGSASRSCTTAGGDGADFGHETTDLDQDGVIDEMVTGAHVAGWNSGNMGIALLGTFTAVDPKAAAVAGLEDLLTELSVRHGLDPVGTVGYVNPVNGTTRTVASIPAHRDWEATQCPGDRLHAQLPSIRQRVADRVNGGGTAPTDAPPTASITAPAAGATVSGTVTVRASANDDRGVTSVEFFVDNSSIGRDTDGTDGWSAAWNTTGAADGTRTLTATARDTVNQTGSSAPVTVTVDNPTTPPPAPLSVTAISPAVVKAGGDRSVTVTGSGFVNGATVRLEGGKGSTPAVISTTYESSSSLRLTVRVGSKATNSSWTVRVTNPDGSSATCHRCLRVER